MKIQFKRIVSAVCALALCASMMPASALADDTTLSPSASPEVSQQTSDDSSSQEEETLNVGEEQETEPEEQEQPSADGVELYSNDLSAATYDWGGHGDNDENYVWNVATISPKSWGDGYNLSAASGEVNSTEHVTVSIRNDEGENWQEIEHGNSKSQTYDSQYIKIEAHPGYYIQYVVVACNDNNSGSYDGLNCQSVGNGAAYTTSGGIGVSTVMLDTEADKNFYHGGRGAPYHILIQLAESPNPVYAVYEAGEAEGTQVTADMLGTSTIVSADGTGANASATNGTSVAFGFEYTPSTVQSITALSPAKTVISANGKWYQFDGWKVTYYTDTVEGNTAAAGVENVFDSLNNESNMGSSTCDVGDEIALSTHVKLVAQWEEMDMFPGAPVTIEVYLDGKLQTVTKNGDFVTISTQDSTAQPTVSVKDGKYVYDYVYETFNCADIGFGVDEGYILQAVEATLVYGSSGSKGITGENGTYTVDNVRGGSTVKLYLATEYNVEYYVDGALSGVYTDSNSYSVISDEVSGLEDNTATGIPNKDMDGVDDSKPNDPATEMQKGYSVVKKFAVQDTITLSGKDGIDGWYKEAAFSNLISEGSIALSAVIAEGSGYTVEGNTVQFFGRTRHPGVTVTKEITSVQRNGETLSPVRETLQAGDVVTYTVTVKNTGNVALTGLTVNDTFSGSAAPVHSSGDFELAWTEQGSGYTGTATIASLPVGASQTSVYTYTVLEADVDKTITNSVSVTGSDDVDDEDTVEKEVGEVTATKSSVKSGNTLPSEVEQAVGSYTNVATNNGVSYIDTVTGNVVFLYKVSVTADFAGAQLTVTDTQDNISVESDTANVTARASIAYVGSNNPDAVADNTSNQVVTISTANQSVDLYYKVTVEVTDNRDDQSEHYTITVGNTANIQNGGFTEEVPGDSVEIRETDKSVEVSKKITEIDDLPGNYGDTTVLHAGDEVTYTITVKNTSTVALENIVIRDAINGTQAGLPTQVTVDGKPVNVTWKSENNVFVGEWNIAKLDVGESVEATYTYTVQVADESSDIHDLLTNRASVPGADTETGDDDTENFVEKTAISVDKTSSVRPNTVGGGMYIDYTVTVTNTGNSTITDMHLQDSMIEASNITASVNGTNVNVNLMEGNIYDVVVNSVGGLEPGDAVIIQYTCTVTDDDLTKNSDGTYTIDNTAEVDVWTESDGPVSGQDTETTTVYAGEITLTPAPIVIYPGGTSGQTIVGDNGTIISDELNLPVLGFLFTDKDNQNISIKDHGTLTMYDVSGLRNGNYSWTATAYNANSTVLYQLAPTEGADNKDDVRIQLTDETGNVWTSGEFEIENYLYKEFKTEIYTNLPDNQNADVVVKIGDNYYKMGTESSTLTVRGTTGQEEVNTVVTDPEKMATDTDVPQAVVDPDAKYYYVSNNDVTTDAENEGKLAVADASSVSLLVDEIVDQTVETDQQYVQMMKNKVEADSGILGAVPADTARVWRFYYMDLVLAANGNAVLTTDQDVEIYWPYPDGITYQDVVDGKYTFTVLHYTGLDRNYESSEFASQLEECDVKQYIVTPTEKGLKFTVPAKDGFSPYALVYQYSTKGPDQTVTEEGDDHPDIAEAIANGTWGQPTPTPAPAVIPQTSDDMPLGMLIGAAVVASAALVVLTVLRRRRRKQ